MAPSEVWRGSSRGLLDTPVIKFTQSMLQGLKEATQTAELLLSQNFSSGFDRWIRSHGG